MNADAPRANFDLLAWFSDDERRLCWVCDEQTAVTITEAPGATFCLACGTISMEGVPIKVGATRLGGAPAKRRLRGEADEGWRTHCSD